MVMEVSVILYENCIVPMRVETVLVETRSACL